MFITQMALPRRTMLRGIGAALALPMLDAMVPALKAAPASAPRMAFFHLPNGMSMPYWTPKKVGQGLELSPVLKVLQPFKDQTIVLSGLSHFAAGLGDGGGPHTRASAAYLTGLLAKRAEGIDATLGTSADQIAARVLGKDTVLDSLELTTAKDVLAGSCDNGYSCLYKQLSWRSASQVNPAESNPRVVFERMFGEESSTAERAKRIRTDKSILDAVALQVQGLEKKLGAADRAAVSEYLTTVREVERRIQKAEKQNSNSELSVGQAPAGAPDTYPEHLALMYDLLHLAFQADVTRVATMQGGEGGAGGYAFIGVPEDHHETSHHQNNPEKLLKLSKINTYHHSEFAKFVEKMKATKDGDGNLLDRSMLMFGASMSDADLHSPLNLPLVLVGGGNGTLKGDRHLKYADDAKTPVCNLLVTMLDKAGVKVDRFGDSTGDLTDL